MGGLIQSVKSCLSSTARPLWDRLSPVERLQENLVLQALVEAAGATESMSGEAGCVTNLAHTIWPSLRRRAQIREHVLVIVVQSCEQVCQWFFRV